MRPLHSYTSAALHLASVPPASFPQVLEPLGQGENVTHPPDISLVTRGTVQVETDKKVDGAVPSGHPPAEKVNGTSSCPFTGKQSSEESKKTS